MQKLFSIFQLTKILKGRFFCQHVEVSKVNANIPTIPFLWDNGQVQGSILSFSYINIQCWPRLRSAAEHEIVAVCPSSCCSVEHDLFFLYFIIVLLFIFKLHGVFCSVAF